MTIAKFSTHNSTSTNLSRPDRVEHRAHGGLHHHVPLRLQRVRVQHAHPVLGAGLARGLGLPVGAV